MIAPSTGKAFAILFQDTLRWDVKSHAAKISSRFPIVDLNGLIADRRNKENIKTFPNATFRILGVSNTSGVFHAYDAKGSEINQPYQKVEAGDFFYNPYRVNVGSIGLVDERLSGGYVSPAYVVFRVVGIKLISEYLNLVLTSSWYNKVLRAATSGAVRQNLTFKLLQGLGIPLPPPGIQESIVNFSQEAETGIEDAKTAIANSVYKLNDALLKFYRSEAPTDVMHSRYFALDFKDLDAWDAKSGRASAFRLACPSFRPMGDFIVEASDMVRPFDEPEKDWPVYGVNNKDGVFLNSHQKGDSFNAPYKRIQKDWFFHNPTRCNVGSLGIVPEVPEDAITSPEYQVWRLKNDVPEPLLPEYVAMLIQTPFFLELVQFNRVGAVKQRMYTENLCQLRIPYLPLTEQRKYASARNKAVARLTKARERLDEVRQEVEEMIIGTREIPK